MIKSDAKVKKLSEVFRSNNPKIITEAIEMLRDEQPFEGAVGLLAALYDHTSEDEIRKSIESFMNDLKDQSAAPEIIAEIRHGWNPVTTRMLVSSCWQSGLDYASYSLDMAEVFMDSDYGTAIECLTVIEESIHSLSPDKKKEIKNLIDKKSSLLKPDMKNLAIELRSILT